MVRHATRLGIDLNDPEIMGTWFDDIRKKIKGIAKKTKSVQLTTDRGTAQLGPGGVTWTDRAATSQDDSSPQIIQSSVGGMADMLKNPLVIGAGVSLLALMLSKKGGKR
ncbi:MAG: hypothetical protein PHE88_12345 [Elusimicrobia bacterium]|nr:hypothetical protein [Elusimicrobiota bacterium]